MKRVIFIFVWFLALVMLPISYANASDDDVASTSFLLKAVVDTKTQQMQVFKNNELLHTWKTSTGRKGYQTPTGTFAPTWLSRHHRSKQYDNTPMPFAVFFFNGYAVHATTATHLLGKTASHGCVRLSKDNAKIFFELVQENGMENTEIKVI